mgnify:CR=1 FL=1
MNGKERVNLSKVIEKMNLVNLTPDIDVKGIWIHVTSTPAYRVL